MALNIHPPESVYFILSSGHADKTTGFTASAFRHPQMNFKQAWQRKGTTNEIHSAKCMVSAVDFIPNAMSTHRFVRVCCSFSNFGPPLHPAGDPVDHAVFNVGEVVRRNFFDRVHRRTVVRCDPDATDVLHVKHVIAARFQVLYRRSQVLLDQKPCREKLGDSTRNAWVVRLAIARIMC